MVLLESSLYILYIVNVDLCRTKSVSLKITLEVLTPEEVKLEMETSPSLVEFPAIPATRFKIAYPTPTKSMLQSVSFIRQLQATRHQHKTRGKYQYHI